MAISVLDPQENTRVPFLRGILTRSLQSAGMPFTEAYELASKVRKKLGQDAEISTRALADLVIRFLEKEGHTEVLERYMKPPVLQLHITVIDRDGQPVPFSKSLLSQSLEICAFPREECFNITAAIEHLLFSSGVSEISSTQLARFTYDYLMEHEPPEMARRYMAWIALSRGGRPLILLMGGTTGTGKSTISSVVAHRLNIVRTQSTDMLREVMRLLIPQRLMPELHVSSFNAWQTLPAWDNNTRSFEKHFVEGYLAQAREVGVGLEGVLKRAEREQLSLILEGVHIYPALQHRLSQQKNTIVVPIVLAVMQADQLKKQLKKRGRQLASRRSERYLDAFDAIWELQSFLLSEADRYDIPIVPNMDVQESIRLVMDAIAERLLKEFALKPEAVFV